MEPEHTYPVLGRIDDYTLHLKLGEGGQANVYLGSKGGQLYALKVYLPGASKEEAFQLQTNFLNKLKDPLLINMIEHRSKALYQLVNCPEEKRNLIVLELADGGELYQYIAKFGRFSPEICRHYAKQLVSVLHYMSQKDIAHRDIKPQNILFDSKFNIKVSDFGLARDSKGKKNDYVLHSRVGTQGYRSPQMEEGKYNGLQSDMFAVGVVLFIMYTGYPPFMGTRSHDRIYKLIRERNFAKFWEKHQKGKPEGFYEPSFKRLLNSFFSSDPARRPTFESLEDDQWWNGDEITQNQLEEYMKAKADVLFENSPILELKKKLFKEKIQQKEEEKAEEIYDECTRGCEEQSQDILCEEEFRSTYQKIKTKKEELPEYTNEKIPYCNEEPGFVVAWIRDALTSFFKQKQTFICTFVEQITPEKFTLNFDDSDYTIELSLEFNVGDEEIVELELVGQLHKSNREGIGVKWIKKNGNFYWLTAIENRLNSQLQHLN